MKYSNGFDMDIVLPALSGRVSWKEAYGSPVPALISPNTTNTSGRYYNDFHGTANLLNVYQTSPKASMSQNEFNTYLSDLAKSVILKSLTAVFHSPEFFERSLLYDRFNQGTELLPNNGKFVGVRICPASLDELALQIESVSLLFNDAVTFNLYCFEEATLQKIWEKEVTTVANSQKVVAITDLVLKYNTSTYSNGVFYLGYFQDDLGSAKAIREELRTVKPRHYYSVSFFEAPQNGALNFDRDQLSYGSHPYGFNVKISAFKDHTSAITDNAYLFDEVQGLQMAADVIERIMHSNQTNKEQLKQSDDITRLMTYMDLNGTAPVSDSPKITGIANKIQAEYKRLRETFCPKPMAKSYSSC